MCYRKTRCLFFMWQLACFFKTMLGLLAPSERDGMVAENHLPSEENFPMVAVATMPSSKGLRPLDSYQRAMRPLDSCTRAPPLTDGRLRRPVPPSAGAGGRQAPSGIRRSAATNMPLLARGCYPPPSGTSRRRQPPHVPLPRFSLLTFSSREEKVRGT